MQVAFGCVIRANSISISLKQQPVILTTRWLDILLKFTGNETSLFNPDNFMSICSQKRRLPDKNAIPQKPLNIVLRNFPQ